VTRTASVVLNGRTAHADEYAGQHIDLDRDSNADQYHPRQLRTGNEARRLGPPTISPTAKPTGYGNANPHRDP